MIQFYSVILVAVLGSLLMSSSSVLVASAALVSLKTSVKLLRGKSNSKVKVYRFLATPANWPNIVPSSFGVVKSSSGSDVMAIEKPLKRRDSVNEIFGLPPILPLTVRWTCVESDEKKGRLDVRSKQGVDGIATDCRMLFEITEDKENAAVIVDLTMEFEPVNVLLCRLALPILSIDNAIALRVLLPNALHEEENDAKSPINKFRKLMGTLYLAAGVAHAADCLLGNSELLMTVGCDPFYQLPAEGQALVLTWCGVGPIAFAASRMGGRVADAGLVLYGAVEVLCAALVASASFGNSGTTKIDPFANAVGAQAIIAASWLYSSRKTAEEVASSA